jgi:hypothetical protein
MHALSRTTALSLLAVAAVAGEALPTKAEVETLAQQAQTWLLKQQDPSGSFIAGSPFTLGITQLAVQALATPPLALKADAEPIAKGLAYAATFRQADGSYQEKNALANYCTSLQLMVFAATGTGSKDEITASQNFLFGIQNKQEGTVHHGGIGYGSKGAGNEDLNNTTYALAALRATGVPSTDPRMQAALKYLERCQNLSSVNTLPWVTNDGGAAYSPDESKAGGSWDRNPPKAGEPTPKLASYGSMTYSLVSSYLALDVSKDDPRVQAALTWMSSNWTLDANPGMTAGKEKQGLIYYYAIMAKTFDTLDATSIQTKGGAVDWRAELFATLKKRAVHPEGKTDEAFWVNEADRWSEGAPQLCTSYVLSALKRIHASLP